MTRRTSSAGIVPGSQVVNVISAHLLGRAEQLLRAMAEDFSGSRTQRTFGPWTSSEDGSEECQGRIVHAGVARLVTLRVGGVPGDIVLLDTNRGISWSFNGQAIEIGNIPNHRLNSVAANIVAVLVVHGSGWKDRSGKEHVSPYGDACPHRPRSDRRQRHRHRRDGLSGAHSIF